MMKAVGQEKCRLWS